MNSTETTQTIRSRLGARVVASALLAVLLTACPTEIKTPTVTLAGVATVTTESTLTLTAIAAPATGSGFNSAGPAITKVELYDGTKKLDEKTFAPYVFEIKLTSSDNGKKQFKAKAYDQAGAVGESNTVAVDVKIAVVDTTPTVVSVDPPNDATGVTSDKVITVRFSEPMKQAETQAAYQSADLPSSAVTFAWSVDGKVMTVKPNAPLEYKSVSGSGEAPKTYFFSLTNTAVDLDGNKLSQLNSKFSTFKQVKVTLENISQLTGSIESSTTNFTCTYICVGDTPGNTGLRGFISFDLSSLPLNLETKNIIDADLKFNVIATIGKPQYSLYLVDQGAHQYLFYIESASYKDLEKSSFYANVNSLVKSYDKDNCEIVPCLNNAPIADDSLYIQKVLGALKSDWENKNLRGSKSQYRFRFPKETDGNGSQDYTIFAKSSGAPSLVVTYLFP